MNMKFSYKGFLFVVVCSNLLF
ncbi:Protein of unknown function [Bacillus cytotoxicus]|uniref:Uncharacterized protein n=1 Tax=Bacillus cytotoxicus TaxID=580165 RepID=A0AAX2CGP6_9BACI|nr:Protein of unknown function [Bacillus cytotoxicus]SCN36185.1 Protein of unknown function [Bacillus cytotoxicus]